MSFKFDRTAFKGQTFKEEQRAKTFSADSAIGRLKVAFYLNSIAFNFDLNNPPRIDKTVFSTRKNNSNG
jgi:hypothetical protein